MTDFLMKFLPWLDLFWLPVAMLVVHPEQRVKSAIFVLACAAMLRLQGQMMESIGYGAGFFGLWHWPLLYRGMAGYGAGIVFYLVTAWFSPKTDPYVFMAAAITIFIASFCLTCGLMVL